MPNYWVKTTEIKITDESYKLEIREEMINVLDENNEFQWEDTSEMEPAYKIRYLTFVKSPTLSSLKKTLAIL